MLSNVPPQGPAPPTVQELSIPWIRVSAWMADEVPNLNLPAPEGLDLVTGAPEVGFIDPLLRRRLSRLARGMLHCAHRVAPEPARRRPVAELAGAPRR